MSDSVASDGETMVEQEGDSLACYIMPIQGEQLLVPQVSIAEMAFVAPIFPDNSGPDWFLGHYSWRNQRVPLISYEKLTKDQGGGINPNGKIAVFNNTGVSPDVPFIAIPTQGIPREININPEDIESNVGNTKPGPFELMYVMAGMEEMVIPNLAALEEAYCGFKDRLA